MYARATGIFAKTMNERTSHCACCVSVLPCHFAKSPVFGAGFVVASDAVQTRSGVTIAHTFQTLVLQDEQAIPVAAYAPTTTYPSMAPWTAAGDTGTTLSTASVAA